tara:strand:- start:114 stop:347 length:234 start_codon:yes stop_codon:yes gene_type:complete
MAHVMAHNCLSNHYQVLSSKPADFFKNLPNCLILLPFHTLGAIAQLVEHLHGMQGVSGSSPLGSIKISRFSKGFQEN